MRVLTEAQDLLLEYLTELGASPIRKLSIITDLWEPEATMEMLRYIAETEEKDLAQLSRIASKISSKYNNDIA